MGSWDSREEDAFRLNLMTSKAEQHWRWLGLNQNCVCAAFLCFPLSFTLPAPPQLYFLSLNLLLQRYLNFPLQARVQQRDISWPERSDPCGCVGGEILGVRVFPISLRGCRVRFERPQFTVCFLFLLMCLLSNVC